MLDPRSKLQYFREQAWLDEWITEARTLVRKAYDEDWKDHAESREQREDSEEPPVSHLGLIQLTFSLTTRSSLPYASPQQARITRV